MKALFVRSVLAALLVLLAVSSSAIEPGPPSRGEIGVRSMMGGEKKPDEKNLEKGPKSEEKPPAPVVEVNVGGNEGRIIARDLSLIMGIYHDEGTFEERTKISIFHFERDIELEAFERVGPVWLVTSDKKFQKRAKFKFQFEKRSYPAGSIFVVLTWWRGDWVISGIPEIDLDNNTATIEADYSGYFVPVRVKSRSEIPMKRYTFPDDEKRDLSVIGLFSYETEYRRSEDILEERVVLREHFRGDIVFGSIPGMKRTGVKLLSAQSIADPQVISFEAKLTRKDDALFATGYDIAEQRGLISAEQKSDTLNFLGMPTMITLNAVDGDTSIDLPTMRGKIDLSGITFDWKLQEMFHFKNFIYRKELIMPHGAADERTKLIVYLQFIIR